MPVHTLSMLYSKNSTASAFVIPSRSIWEAQREHPQIAEDLTYDAFDAARADENGWYYDDEDD
ncbi:MAG: hypothetical protein VX910_08825 [Candidatus Latescibacterota bacterium]|nr:hypothetical protein [Candidatus Latescibacterota bacterium]